MTDLPSPWMVNVALAGLLENPPFGLGESALAKLLFPGEPDRLTRGALTRRILCQAIESLKVRAPDSHPRQRPYHIFTALCLEGKTLKEICDDLAISRATYGRYKQRGFQWIVAYLPYLMHEQVRMVGE